MSVPANLDALTWRDARACGHGVDQREVETLTGAIAAGDTDAFSRFYRARFDQMLAEAVRATGRDESFCLDVVQDAMMRVIRSMKPMPSEDDLRRWLRTVVRSCAYDRLRAEVRRSRRELEAADRGAKATAVTDRDEDRRRLAWLRRQLGSLDEGSVQLLLMRHRFGWTLQQIGVALGRTAGAVDGRLRRIAAALRRRAEEEFDD